jgi:hypothetical protein
MTAAKETQIGLLIGREWSWPSAFIAEVNRRDSGVQAGFVKIGGTFSDSPCPYQVIIDRTSHEIPYYRTYLKYAALNGCYIINNPFMSSSDDKFFGIALTGRLGIQTPRTVALPNKRVETENVAESFRNLEYPMDWQGIIDYVGVTAILKDMNTGGRRVAQRVNDVDELIRWYDESDTLTVVLQEVIESDVHVHCFVVGQTRVRLARYSREDAKYLPELGGLSEGLRTEMAEAAVLLSQAYRYDLNMVEFVVKDGQAILINPSNPAPDLDINLLTPDHFNWCVQEIASLAIKLCQSPQSQFDNYSWKRTLSRQG